MPPWNVRRLPTGCDASHMPTSRADAGVVWIYTTPDDTEFPAPHDLRWVGWVVGTQDGSAVPGVDPVQLGLGRVGQRTKNYGDLSILGTGSPPVSSCCRSR